jgi:hypothetical protein
MVDVGVMAVAAVYLAVAGTAVAGLLAYTLPEQVLQVQLLLRQYMPDNRAMVEPVLQASRVQLVQVVPQVTTMAVAMAVWVVMVATVAKAEMVAGAKTVQMA